jgi:hypothetical protein
MLEALCRQSSTTLDIVHAEDGHADHSANIGSRCYGACYTATPYRGIALHRNEGPLRRNRGSVTHDGQRADAVNPGAAPAGRSAIRLTVNRAVDRRPQIGLGAVASADVVAVTCYC